MVTQQEELLFGLSLQDLLIARIKQAISLRLSINLPSKGTYQSIIQLYQSSIYLIYLSIGNTVYRLINGEGTYLSIQPSIYLLMYQI
jgi:hypothetical protein